MPTLGRVTWFAQSRASRMHFDNQHLFVVRRRGIIPEIRGLLSGDGPAHSEESWESHQCDTNSRLLTDTKR